MSLLDDAAEVIRFQSDGVPERGQAAWIRVFGQCTPRPGGCWEYMRRLNRSGYGSIRVGRRTERVHRVAWSHAHGTPAPADLNVCHTCDNPPCCNPAHLFLGTQAENNADRHAKGRTVLPANGPDFWRSKTHCPHGHPYSGDNVRYRKDGSRRCAACYRVRAANRRAAMKESS